MKNMKWIILSVLLVALSGCKQNPFDGLDGEISDKKLEQKEVYPEYAIAAEPIYYCEEMKPCTIQIRPQVPDPGKPIMRIGAYPPGATEHDFVWDPKKKMYVLTWTPGFDLVEPSKGTGITKDVPLALRLWSSERPETIVTDTVQISVKNTQQEWSVKTNGYKTAPEGGVLTQEVTIESADYPNGPFQLFAKDAPTGTVIEQDQTDPKKFKVTFKPDFTFVKLSETPPPIKGPNGYYRNVLLTYVAKDPGEGLERTSTTRWTITDVRKSPVISGPTALGVREQAVFSIRADDLNAEFSPEFQKIEPPFGRIETTVTKVSRPGTSDYPSTFLDVQWVDIPASKQGTSETVTFQACAKSVAGNACVDHQIDVKFLFSVAAPPTISRTDWPLGQVKYAKPGETLRVDIAVEDPEQKGRPVQVEVFPESMRSEVQWLNGQVVINPETEGLIQFKLEATSVPGQKQSESFMMNVLPKSWSNVVVFSSDLEKPETQALLNVMPDAAVVHPFFQKADERVFAMRKVFVVTSELLLSMSSQSDWTWLDAKMSEVPNLWIATPLVDKLKEHSIYFNQLLTDYELKLPGRLKFIHPTVPLKNFHLELGSYKLEAPTKPVEAAGKMTSESADPSLIEVTSGTASKCKDLFTLKSSRALAELAAVCEHKEPNAGKLVLFGTEFVDFTFNPADAGLLNRWVNTLLQDGGVQP